MTKPPLKNMLKSQEDYLQIILQYRDIVGGDDLSINQISMMIDEIKCFWLEYLKVLEFELEELTEKHSCFLLSGAIYLNVADYGHYYFKSFGDYHLLFDPFLRMEPFFRIPGEDLGHKETIRYFKKAYTDTIEILTKHKNYFYVLPIREMAIEDSQKHNEMLNKFFWNFVSSSFNKDFENEEAFCSKYQTFEEIEKDLDEYIRKNLIFNDPVDCKLSLRERIDQYCNSQMNISPLIRDKSEAQVFLISVYSFVSQIMDILLICAYLRLYPCIRFNITFNYLSIIMYTFIHDKTIKETLEKTIIFYIFYYTIKKERFKKVSFSEYCRRIENLSLMDNVLGKIHSMGIDIFKGGVKEVASIIDKEFKNIV